ncbi:MAG TPA: S8 family peptidase [Pyrinomonadaceae bacterium]|jgi:subtilisin family serine protease|nr:S8 family peptidase [Pyrinomonadaceae bacterium]
MSRNKYILYVVLGLTMILGLAFGIQVKKLQRQVRSAVRIVPAEPKSREGVDQNGLASNGATSLARPAILVKFRAGVSEDTITQITARFDDQVQDEIEAVPGLTTIHDPDNKDAGGLAAKYQALPEVEYAEPNYEISIDQTASDENLLNDPRITEQWALTDLSVPQAWANTKGSRDIVVAVLDSGVEYTHADLRNNIWTRPADMKPYQDRDLGTIDDIHGYNAVANDGDPIDENGHGTNCAGIIGAECGNSLGVCGVNWKIQIMSLKVVNAGGFGYVADAVEALNYAIARKHAGVNLRVINASWGLTEHSQALEAVISKAHEAGILFVAASGNTGTNIDATPRYPASYRLGNIISVAATDKSGALAQFSNYGTTSVNVAAPGKDILTTALGNDYKECSGTSMAAPMVTAVAALSLSDHPNLSVDQLRSLMLRSVDKLPDLQGKIITGGRINAAKAAAH